MKSPLCISRASFRRLTRRLTGPAGALLVCWALACLGSGCGASSTDNDGSPVGQETLNNSTTSTGDTTTAGGGTIADAGDDDAGDDGDTGEDDAGAPDADEVIYDGPDRATLAHSFGEFELNGGQETVRCVSWTLNNDKPLYVEQVSLSNNGAYHHSNWFVVPEDMYPGEDGFWRCGSRDFEEINAALAGTVLFAQSTQSRVETQRLGDGVVIKIPPRHKVVADVHLLNLSPRAYTTELRMGLDVIHPSKVDVIVTPFRLAYTDLNIPPSSRSRMTGECDVGQAYAGQAGKPLDIKLYWVLPHYHALGDHFSLQIMGGPRDGEMLFELDGFNAEANGQAFNPPIDLTGAEGLRFSCGFNNPRDEWVGWGFGDQEMCLMLGFAESDVLMDNGVLTGDAEVGVDEDGVIHRSGPCLSLGLNKSPNQGPPTEEELRDDLYVPESNPEDVDLPPTLTCRDPNPLAEADGPATLNSIAETFFEPTCTFSSCHDASNPAMGLDLTHTPGLHERLLNHQVRANVDMPLVNPGDPQNSWLFQIISQCAPTDGAGAPVALMPKGSPVLAPDGTLAEVRDWILQGALDD